MQPIISETSIADIIEETGCAKLICIHKLMRLIKPGKYESAAGPSYNCESCACSDKKPSECDKLSLVPVQYEPIYNW